MSPVLIVEGILVLILLGVFLAYRGGYLHNIPELLERKRRQRHYRKYDVEEKYVSVVGQPLAYFDGGPKHPTVLLLHGFAGDKDDWSEMAKIMVGAKYRVVAPDLPGFGQNDKDPKRKYDVTTLTKLVRAFTRQADVSRFHIVGHSLGAMVAASYAYASPVEILSLTLIEPLGVHVPYESDLDKAIKAGRNPLLVSTPAAYDGLLKFYSAKKPPELPAKVKEERAQMLADNVRFYQAMWNELRDGERANLLDLLAPEIKTRTLVLGGDRSRVVHASTGEAMARTMQNARFETIKGAGHIPMLEAPQKTAEICLSFFRTSQAAAAEPGFGDEAID